MTFWFLPVLITWCCKVLKVQRGGRGSWWDGIFFHWLCFCLFFFLSDVSCFKGVSFSVLFEKKKLIGKYGLMIVQKTHQSLVLEVDKLSVCLGEKMRWICVFYCTSLFDRKQNNLALSTVVYSTKDCELVHRGNGIICLLNQSSADSIAVWTVCLFLYIYIGFHRYYYYSLDTQAWRKAWIQQVPQIHFINTEERFEI